ncbi:hypothetical protein [Paenibacillus harenae]|uniref:hypothetical protein n=1 Tax=Paenibacillus harenae TaxID=306543 RepID=UPI000405837D|nr:hypothetical protein [Paenibacillus harenae]
MELTSQIAESIGSVIEEMNENLPPDRQLRAAPDLVLFGNGGALDSLGLVHFIVAVEQAIEDRFHAAVVLADEKAMSLRNSPFRTIGILSDYIAGLLQEQVNHE